MSTSCGNPAVETDALMTRRLKFDKTKQCVKCKERSGNIVIRHAVYCKTCFFPLIITRFRKTLEPVVNPTPAGARKKGLKASGSLVLGFSGGLGSTALLDLVAKSYFHTPTDIDGQPRGGTSHPRNQVGVDSGIWKGKPAVCYVELSSVVPNTIDRIEDARKVVKSYSTDTGFEFDFIPLRIEDAFDPNWWKGLGSGDLATAAQSVGIDITDEHLPLADLPSSSTSAFDPLLALQGYLASLPTQTAKESAIQTLTRLLLLYTAASRGASHLLLGTSLTTLSVNLISGISQGAGFSVAEEAFEEWAYHGSVSSLAGRPTDTSIKKDAKSSPNIRIVRPLRDIGMKECAFWMWWCQLTVIGKKRISSGRQSIVSLTRDFITGLEKDFPSTVNTIARTCAKVTPKETSNSTCLLCERPAQPQAQEWKARISIRSYTDKTFRDSGDPLPPHLTEFPQELEVADDPARQLASRVCYACHTTLTSRGNKANSGRRPGDAPSNLIPLPSWAQATLRHSDEDVMSSRQLDQNEMRAQIQDFILDG